MKTLLIIAVLLLQGCSTVRGLGQLAQGIGKDTVGLSDAVKNEIAKDK